MKKILVSAAALVAFAGGSALAADLPPAPPVYRAPAAYVPVAPIYSWTGFYIGVSGGYGWGGNGNVNPQAVGTPLGGFADSPAQVAAQLAGLNSLNTNPKGGIVGGQIGYNYQAGPVVWGIETDFSWADIHGASTQIVNVPVTGFPPFGVATNLSVSQKLESFGTLRGRVGVTPFDRGLLYVTGGLAYGQGTSNIAIAQTETGVGATDTFNASAGSGSKFLWGWTAGGGGEVALSPNWTIKAEGLYYDLQNLNYTATTISGFAAGGPVLFSSTTISPSAQFKGVIARGGVNYKF